MKYLFLFFPLMLLIACSSQGNTNSTTPPVEMPTSPTKIETAPAEKDTPKVPIVEDEVAVDPVVEATEPQDPAVDGTTIKAQFKEFYLGDAEHYIFEDETGKIWDFARCNDYDFEFARELDAAEADESNQGWGSNTALHGKWFTLTYSQVEQEQYIDGPIVTVEVIEEVVIVE